MKRNNMNRVRNKHINFRVAPLEYAEIHARIKMSGMPKGEYFIQSLLHQRICVYFGKYQSDRLSLEFKKLREALETLSDIEDISDTIVECKALLEQLQAMISDNQNVSAEDFKTKKKP